MTAPDRPGDRDDHYDAVPPGYYVREDADYGEVLVPTDRPPVSVTGTRWTVLAVARIVDGDTVHLTRERAVDLDGRRYLLRDAAPVSIRLVWVDTPERGRPGWARARGDLMLWIEAHADDLEVVCYESGGWDRIMGDLLGMHGDEGESASAWLMTSGDGGAGWPPYRPS